MNRTAALLVLAVVGPALAGPHEHGVARLDVATEGTRLAIALQAPLDGFLGFERAPRSDAERKAAADLMARLKAPEGLFTPDPAAGCRFERAEVKAPVLEPGAKPAKGEHADLEAEFSYTCNQPQALRTLDVGLFEAYKRLQRIEVQVAGAKAQSKITLRRPARQVPLAR